MLDDPVEPPEDAGMRAANLVNLNLILHPTGVGERKSDRDGSMYEYVACEVWVFEPSGVVDHGTDVHFSGWRSVQQLKQHLNGYVVCKPTLEGPNKAMVLSKVSPRAKQKAVELEHVVKLDDKPDAGEDPF